MRKRSCLLGVLMMLLALGSVASAEFVYNGDMEIGGGEGILPDGWTHYNEGLYTTSTETPSGTGQSMYLFDNSGATYGDIVYQNIPSGFVAEEYYTFSLSYKGEAGLRVMLYYPGQGGAYADNFAATSEWTDISFNFAIIPQYTAGSLEIHMYTISPYTPLYIDNVSIVEMFLEGDANRDGVVSAGDYASVQSNFGNTGEVGILGDANLDGVVSAGDYASVQANFGAVKEGAASINLVPEPATMVLLSMGVVAMVRRRK